jgi:hypothetical protein
MFVALAIVLPMLFWVGQMLILFWSTEAAAAEVEYNAGWLG